jgi:RecB family endonuclease NucS
MRMVVATCTVDYAGRLSAHLPEATRLLVVKADGTILIHADAGSKALNWMSAPCRLVEGPGRWSVTGAKGERLDITISAVHADVEAELGPEPGLTKTHGEAEIQQLLAGSCDCIEAGLRLVRREHPTPIGPVDLLCLDEEGGAVAVEVKRVGDIDGVEQLTRYLRYLERDGSLRSVRGIYVAGTVKPQARTLAEDRGIACVEVDFDVLAARRLPDLTLFEA